jgi:hypothetical protein
VPTVICVPLLRLIFPSTLTSLNVTLSVVLNFDRMNCRRQIR